MEILTKNEQLTKGTSFNVMDGDKVTSYEYLCVHPHNIGYILAINRLSQNEDKLYISTLLKSSVYVGDYDVEYFINKTIEYLQKIIENSKQMLVRIRKLGENLNK